MREGAATLPATLRLADGEVFACHGSPAGGDLDYLFDAVASGRAVLALDDAIRSRLVGIGSARLVLCGHTHMPRMVRVGDVTVVNPGSIAMPAYTDDDPVPHAIEAGAPHARYAVVTREPGGIWSAALHAVAYDWDRAAGQARRNGKPGVARWTATGRGLGDFQAKAADLRTMHPRHSRAGLGTTRAAPGGGTG